MMKKLIKTLMFVTVSGLLAVPAFTQEYKSSVSGDVQVDWKMYVQSTSKDASNDTAAKKDNYDDMSVSEDDTFFAYTGTYTNGETTGSASLRFKATSEKRLTLSATTKEGDWTGTAMAEWEEYWNGGTLATIDRRDQWVKLDNGMLSVQLGYDQYFVNHRKGFANTFATANHSGNDLGYDRFDSRFDALRLGFAMPDLGLDVGLIVSNNKNSEYLPGSTLVAKAVAAKYKATGTADTSYDSTGIGLTVDYKNADVAGLDISFEYGSWSVKGNKDRDASVDGEKATGGLIGLGIGVTPIEALTIGLNYTSSTGNYTVKDATGDAVEIKDPLDNRNDFFLSVDYNIPDMGGIGFVYGTTSWAKGEKGGVEEKGDSMSATHLELAYKIKVSNVTVTAGYISESYGGEEDGTLKGKGGSSSLTRLRMVYSF